MSAYFRLLGPLQAEVNGVDKTPTAQKMRAVLAMLLLASNSVLTGDAVAEELWGAEPPPSARNTLQSYIVHLRQRLNSDDARIETRSHGYELVVDPPSVDLTAFRENVSAARHARTRADLERAREALTRGLQLWRGQCPLVNVSLGPVLQSSYAYLAELKLSATERRVAIDLELGRHHDVLGDLTLLVRQHPLNESLTAQLMLAFYRSGRRYASLEAYHGLRRRLAGELGLDACPSLQRMHQAVLTCDPRLDPGSDTGGHVGIDTLSA